MRDREIEREGARGREYVCVKQHKTYIYIYIYICGAGVSSTGILANIQNSPMSVSTSLYQITHL